jgi:DEAD/DEAH box helicase domain-containing protein
MSLPDLLHELRRDPQFMANVMAWRTIPASAGHFAPVPASLDGRLRAVLSTRGVEQLYCHQAQAVELALGGHDLAVVTPTASGKTLCYTLPVLHALLNDPAAHALYLFPTKALAHDQLDEIGEWRVAIERQSPVPSLPVSAIATYDGDTPGAQRAMIRRRGRLILTNPDMLHVGILPYHTNWAEFLGGLRYVVIDEMHTYRGIFGSHVANVLRRLQRLCAFYGSRPQFITTSATIGNPQQLAEQLVERPITVVTENGAPRGEKSILLYNPPLYDAERGLRRSSILEAQGLAERTIRAGVQTIIFARARLTTEVLLTYLRDNLNRVRSTEWRAANDGRSTLRGYRAGYLPEERRAIETGLRNGEVRGVVATNALELGIDIGQLQAAILCGYPGSIASAWQQMGRAGRTREAALAILVATGGALDQYIIRHPEFLFERSPEQARLHADNLLILVKHMRCAAFELPFQAGDSFGSSPFTADVLALLVEQGTLQRHGERFFWCGKAYPAQEVNLRTTTSDTVIIQTGPPTRILGVIDRASAPLLVHVGAIYLHEGQSYRVDELDLGQNLAQVTPASVDYYTEATSDTQIEVLAEYESRLAGGVRVAHGELRVQSQVIGFRRIRRFIHETLSVQPLDYPPQVIETSGYWFGVLPATQRALEEAGLWFDSINDYGPNWQEQRAHVRARDRCRCTLCGAPETPDRQHDVHHRVPFRTFGYVPGLNEHYRLANRLDNLTLLCRNCHQRVESTVRVHSGLDGLAYALGNLAPLHLMCDAQDIGVAVMRSGATSQAAGGVAMGVDLPALFVYERAMAGLGFSLHLYEVHEELLAAAGELVATCPCMQGCPACVGPVLESATVQLPTKQLTKALIEAISSGAPPPASLLAHAEVNFMF